MKGICLKEPLFIATIKGIKTQTRRIIPNADSLRKSVFVESGYETLHGNQRKPRYNVGEVLYLKEPYNDTSSQYRILYKFDYDVKDADNKFWINKLFMPEIDARHFIKIIAVRAERLQDISDEDCIREGIVATESIAEDIFDQVYENGLNMTDKTNGVLNIQYETPREAYKELINSIHGKGTWEENPFVWVYDYELYKEEL